MTSPLVIITGASSGIGAALAKLFAQSGYNIGLLSRNRKAMEALALPNAMCIETDVTKIESVQAAIAAAEAKFGAVDCLINNAGFAMGGNFNDISHNDHVRMMEVNLLGTMNTIEVILPGMQTRKMGTIINISSVADRSVRPLLPTYAATKAAVKSLSESLRVANAKYGIRVCNVAPAKVKTPLVMMANIAEGELIAAEDIAKNILWIYQQPQSICIRDLVIAPTAYEP